MITAKKLYAEKTKSDKQLEKDLVEAFTGTKSKKPIKMKAEKAPAPGAPKSNTVYKKNGKVDKVRTAYHNSKGHDKTKCGVCT